MEIKFTKEQYEALIKMLYLGNCMINDTRMDRINEFDDIENYIFSFAGNFGLENYADFDQKYKRFFPSRQFEESTEIMKYEDYYNNDIFWEELIDRFGERDFIKKYGVKAIEKMSRDERFMKEAHIAEKYAKEFEVNGIENVTVKMLHKSEPVINESQDEITSAREKKYIKGFAASRYFAELPGELQETAQKDIELFLEFLHNYEGVGLKNISRYNAEHILTELFPQKVAAPPEKFYGFTPILTAFFSYLKSEKVIKKAEDIINGIKDCEEIMIERAADPKCYGMMKAMAMQMLKDKINMKDQSAVDSWIANFNSCPYEERDKMFTHLELPSIFPKSGAKIGRNEFCSCGSGKKYKKCCGK